MNHNERLQKETVEWKYWLAMQIRCFLQHFITCNEYNTKLDSRKYARNTEITSRLYNMECCVILRAIKTNALHIITFLTHTFDVLFIFFEFTRNFLNLQENFQFTKLSNRSFSYPSSYSSYFILPYRKYYSFFITYNYIRIIAYYCSMVLTSLYFIQHVSLLVVHHFVIP